MSDSDSDECPLVRVDSGPKKFKTVPTDTEFFIKLVGVKKRRLIYKLKEGYSLPYQVELGGKYSRSFLQDFTYFNLLLCRTFVQF